MKVTAAMAVLAFVAVQAAAVTPHQARDAAAVADADPKRWFNFCGVPGQACGRKRSAEPDANPEARRRRYRWFNFCGVPGQACAKARDAPEVEVGSELGHCGTPGQPCAMIKRTANAIAEAVADADADPEARRRRFRWFNFCGVPGQACAKARDLIDTVADHTNDVYGAIYEREAEAEADASPKRWFNFCGVPGQACGRKRDAVAEASQKVKRDAEADPKRWFNFCGVPGQACGKPRNAEAMADAINKADPTLFKSTCFAEGGECDTLLKIQKAFAESKKQAALERQLDTPAKKLAHCGGKNECTLSTHAHQFAAEHAPKSAKAEEAKCNGPEGLCTLAARDLEGLEETINSAVEEMIADQGIEQ